jgi:hypothetical protein
MRELLHKYLREYKKSSIALPELEGLVAGRVDSYEAFAELIVELEQEQVLTMVKSKGRTGRTPSLAYQYRIDKKSLMADFHRELQQYRLQLHPDIRIDSYFRQDPSVWKGDLPYLRKIDAYLRRSSLPTEKVSAAERSFEVVGDEKWIENGNGKEVLDRAGLFEALQIMPISDPLMLAINPKQIDRTHQFHLIVENKATYQGLLPALIDSPFSTLIYGQGNKIVKSMEQFEAQYPVSAQHRFFYFGDLDKSGIAIWNSLNERRRVMPALPFYRACLSYAPAKGKEYQKANTEALEHFLRYFTEEEKKAITRLFLQGEYYPQEVLKAKELQSVWRNEDWNNWI